MPGPDGGAGLRWGVEPMCAVLSEHGVPISPSTYYEWITKTPTRRQLRDAELVEIITAPAEDKKNGKFVQTLGSRKMWIRLRGQGHDVARCTVERIMREQGWEGARYGSKHKTTDRRRQPCPLPGSGRPTPSTLPAPNRLWVADFTYVSTWMGFVYVAFVDRRLQPPDRRLAGRQVDDHRPGPRRRRACLLHPRPGRHHQPARADRAQRRGQPIHLGGVHPAAHRRRRRPLGRLGRRRPGQRAGRDHRRVVQERSSSVGKAPGATSTRSSWPPPNGSTGSTPNGPHEYLDDFTPEAVEKLHYDHRRTPPKAG